MDFKLALSNVPVVPIKVGDATVWVMLQKFNLASNIKVIPTWWMIKGALERGELDKGKTVLEASSWNTWISLAFWWKIFWLKVKIILPESTAECKKKLIKSYGAEVEEVPWITEDAIRRRDELVANQPDAWRVPNQFTNRDNFWSHYHITAENILNSLKGEKIDFFVAWIGTSWTLLGVGKRLKEAYHDLKIVAVSPKDKVEGLRNFATTKLKIPFFEDYKHLIDDWFEVFEKEAFEGVNHLAQKGYFCGISSWAAFVAVQKLLSKYPHLRNWVMIAPDGGDMYFERVVNYLDVDEIGKCGK